MTRSVDNRPNGPKWHEVASGYTSRVCSGHWSPFPFVLKTRYSSVRISRRDGGTPWDVEVSSIGADAEISVAVEAGFIQTHSESPLKGGAKRL